MSAAPLAPLEYDPSTGGYRSMSRYSAPTNLLWTLVVTLAVFGFADHTVWIAAGVLAAVLAVVETVLLRRARARATTRS